MHINVLYEDNHLLIVEKPVNIPVQGDSSKDRDLLNILKQYIKEKYNKPGDVYLGLIHRLDRPVGGAMVFAKTSKAASRLSDELRRHQIYRKYLAVTRGFLPKKKGRLTDYLWKDRRKNIVSAVSPDNKDAKKAVLDYKVLQSSTEGSLVEVELKTGRSHQIRVQFANQGSPLYGDQKYGQHVNKPGQQIALWASRLSIKHPTKGEMITVDCPPPDKHPWSEFA
ncbi:RluA family pseudouridine synthase [Salinicoccus halodurans]|uniref:RNA pseudouridylate synthase n=1 Tax=Salinicoccus halodurans TaxID=407035 RepID=A0A0F7HIL3_9STAP|nr:RluA family pseudouridine synthase [Salinicoccus halodurans]AKG72823.1 pseudouridine synthase [Salinicoccus halodurans]SFK74721.1 23S rRNA pseudouridine1911/1915/1917 synthase [Salinicoccus halodurans]